MLYLQDHSYLLSGLGLKLPTHAEHIRTVTNGSLMSQVFLAVGTSVVLYLTFVLDWSPLRQVRIQSPITFVKSPCISLRIVTKEEGMLSLTFLVNVIPDAIPTRP